MTNTRKNSILPKGYIIEVIGNLEELKKDLYPPSWGYCDGSTYINTNGETIQTPNINRKLFLLPDIYTYYFMKLN